MKPLPANVRQDIIERTDGVPLFVEEMTKAVLETQQSCFMAGPIVWPVGMCGRATGQKCLVVRSVRLSVTFRR